MPGAVGGTALGATTSKGTPKEKGGDIMLAAAIGIGLTEAAVIPVFAPPCCIDFTTTVQEIVRFMEPHTETRSRLVLVGKVPMRTYETKGPFYPR